MKGWILRNEESLLRNRVKMQPSLKLQVPEPKKHEKRPGA